MIVGPPFTYQNISSHASIQQSCPTSEGTLYTDAFLQASGFQSGCTRTVEMGATFDRRSDRCFFLVMWGWTNKYHSPVRVVRSQRIWDDVDRLTELEDPSSHLRDWFPHYENPRRALSDVLASIPHRKCRYACVARGSAGLMMLAPVSTSKFSFLMTTKKRELVFFFLRAGVQNIRSGYSVHVLYSRIQKDQSTPRPLNFDLVETRLVVICKPSHINSKVATGERTWKLLSADY